MQKVLGLDLSKVTMPEAIEAMVEAWLDAQVVEDSTANSDDDNQLGNVELKQLSARELQVLQEIACGSGSPATAKKLGLSMDTVKSHTARILRKLQAKDRANAVAIAIRSRLIY
jgi:DNA-binding NarL/FixJ family response regulator